MRTLLLTLLLPFCSVMLRDRGAFAIPPPDPRTEVVLVGLLHVDDLDMADVVVELDMDGETTPVRISGSGRFTMTVPSGKEGLLRVRKPGHVSKEVKVDTHHAQDGSFQQAQRRLRFAVILVQERFMAGQVPAGPVGTLGFEPGGGCVVVDHHSKLIVRPRNTMVF